MEELWVYIPMYEWQYKISILGNVLSVDYNHTGESKLLKNWVNKKWYKYVIFIKNWKRHQFSVHRLVAQAFIPNPDNKPEVNHRDWNTWNNWLNTDWKHNLERCTRSENMQHAIKSLWRKPNYLVNNPPMKWKFWKDSWLSKPINQHTLDWEFIRTRDSANDIMRWLKIWDPTHITACCKWKRKTSCGFIWKYTNFVG